MTTPVLDHLAPVTWNNADPDTIYRATLRTSYQERSLPPALRDRFRRQFEVLVVRRRLDTWGSRAATDWVIITPDTSPERRTRAGSWDINYVSDQVTRRYRHSHKLWIPRDAVISNVRPMEPPAAAPTPGATATFTNNTVTDAPAITPRHRHVYRIRFMPDTRAELPHFAQNTWTRGMTYETLALFHSDRWYLLSQVPQDANETGRYGNTFSRGDVDDPWKPLCDNHRIYTARTATNPTVLGEYEIFLAENANVGDFPEGAVYRARARLRTGNSHPFMTEQGTMLLVTRPDSSSSRNNQFWIGLVEDPNHTLSWPGDSDVPQLVRDQYPDQRYTFLSNCDVDLKEIVSLPPNVNRLGERIPTDIDEWREFTLAKLDAKRTQHGWCGEYEESVVTPLGLRTPIHPRLRNHTVTVTVTVEQTVTVEAMSLAEAEALARQQVHARGNNIQLTETPGRNTNVSIRTIRGVQA